MCSSTCSSTFFQNCNGMYILAPFHGDISTNGANCSFSLNSFWNLRHFSPWSKSLVQFSITQLSNFIICCTRNCWNVASILSPDGYSHTRTTHITPKCFCSVCFSDVFVSKLQCTEITQFGDWVVTSNKSGFHFCSLVTVGMASVHEHFCSLCKPRGR